MGYADAHLAPSRFTSTSSTQQATSSSRHETHADSYSRCWPQRTEKEEDDQYGHAAFY